MLAPAPAPENISPEASVWRSDAPAGHMAMAMRCSDDVPPHALGAVWCACLACGRVFAHSSAVSRRGDGVETTVETRAALARGCSLRPHEKNKQGKPRKFRLLCACAAPLGVQMDSNDSVALLAVNKKPKAGFVRVGQDATGAVTVAVTTAEWRQLCANFGRPPVPVEQAAFPNTHAHVLPSAVEQRTEQAAREGREGRAADSAHDDSSSSVAPSLQTAAGLSSALGPSTAAATSRVAEPEAERVCYGEHRDGERIFAALATQRPQDQRDWERVDNSVQEARARRAALVTRAEQLLARADWEAPAPGGHTDAGARVHRAANGATAVGTLRCTGLPGRAGLVWCGFLTLLCASTGARAAALGAPSGCAA